MYENEDNGWQTATDASQTTPVEREIETEEVASSPWGSLLLWSLVLTFFSVLNPLFTHFAGNLQSQELYASWAMTRGQVAYTDIFSTSGFLLMALSWLSGYLPFHLLLWIGEFLALWVSGVATFRLSYHITQNQRISKTLAQLFYGFLAVLGLGGLYATVYALPFLLWMANFVMAYTRGRVSDKRFILYGLMGAISFLIAPFATVVLAGVAFITLLVTNIRQKKKAAGVYQFLAALLGFSLGFYPLAYATVWNGSFGDAVGQVIFALTNVQLYHSHFWLNLVVYLVLPFLLGIGYALSYVLRAGGKGSFEASLFAVLGFVIVWLVSLFTPDFGLYHLLPALPFFLILLALWQSYLMEKRVGGAHSRRTARQETVFYRYLTSSHLLPLVAVVLALACPLVDHYLIHGRVHQERQQIARYLRQHSESNDRIYAWDTTAQLYQDSQRLSGAAILSPSLYLTNSENRIDLTNSLQVNTPRYIVVNNQVPVSKDVQKILTDNYQETSEKYSHFKLYQLK